MMRCAGCGDPTPNQQLIEDSIKACCRSCGEIVSFAQAILHVHGNSVRESLFLDVLATQHPKEMLGLGFMDAEDVGNAPYRLRFWLKAKHGDSL